MNSQERSETRTPSIETSTIFGVVVIVFGIICVYISKYMSNNYFAEFGWILVAIGTPLILGKLFFNIFNSNLISILLFIRKENLISISKDKARNKKTIIESILGWAQNYESDIIKIKGVSLNLVFGNNGVLKECIEEKKIINRDRKEIRVLLLNPYSMNAITRSIQESRPFVFEKDPVIAICGHTLDEHRQHVLYQEFEQTLRNIRDLIKHSSKHKITIECRIYSTLSPSFLLINEGRAISENLILSKVKDKAEGKLYGVLPIIVYGKGEIKDSLENYFDYMWNYDSISIDDFHERVEEKYYEINRLFLLYNLQNEIWERQWQEKSPGRSFGSTYDMLYQGYKLYFPDHSPKSILDLGCGDGGGGSLTILKEHPDAKIDFIDVSVNAIKLLKANIINNGLDSSNINMEAVDMLTFLNRCAPLQYSLIHANFSIIYMTKIKAIEIYKKIFNALDSGGVFMLSLWTTNYFKMPISSKHGEAGCRPGHIFTRVPMTEDLQVLIGGSDLRKGEIRRFYRDYKELLEEFEIADENKGIDIEMIHYKSYENDAILRVWLKKK